MKIFKLFIFKLTSVEAWLELPVVTLDATAGAVTDVTVLVTGPGSELTLTCGTADEPASTFFSVSSDFSVAPIMAPHSGRFSNRVGVGVWSIGKI